MAEEFADRLNAILADPKAMGQILSLAQSLTGGEETGPSPAQSEEDSSVQEAPPSAAPDLPSMLQLLGGSSGESGGGSPLSALGELDPKLLQLGARLLGELGQEDDRRTALLSALRPFVKKERYAKLDRAIQIARLSRVIRTAFRFFQEEGQGRV